jgi:hypothetical protein
MQTLLSISEDLSSLTRVSPSLQEAGSIANSLLKLEQSLYKIAFKTNERVPVRSVLVTGSR